MLKSLFFRQKAETEELLPPPPPFPSMELEEPEAVSEDTFEGLFKDLEKPDLKEEIKETKAKQKKLSKKELKRLAKIKVKEAKLRKKEEKKRLAPKEDLYNLDKDFDFEAEPEFEDLEELGIGELEAETGISPKEIEEAEDEIANAIDGIKKEGKKPFFSGLFEKRAAEQAPMPEFESDELGAIKKKINDSRNALMNLDLEAAKNDYVEIMRAYNKLKPEVQAKIYHEIRDLYYERKSAEELKG